MKSGGIFGAYNVTASGIGAAASNHTHSYTSLSGRPTGLDSGYVRTGQKAGTKIGNYATTEGYNTTASGESSHAEGHNTTASGESSHAEGVYTIASGESSHAEGSNTIASGKDSHAEGYKAIASGTHSHAEGIETNAKGGYSHAGGYYTIANQCQYAIGSYNVESNSSEDRLIIGSGSNSIRKNCFRVSRYATYSVGAYNASGADYAEYFEWLDGNPKSQDRVGYFVTLDKDKIKIAKPKDYILGVISSAPSVIGNSYDDQWSGMELLDDWGRVIMEAYISPVKYEDIKHEDDTTEVIEIFEEMTGMRPKINPDYNNNTPYIGRSERPEWAPVGMLGVLRVRDDGTCQVNGYCKVADGGIATAAESGWRVIARVTDNIIKVVFK